MFDPADQKPMKTLVHPSPIRNTSAMPRRRASVPIRIKTFVWSDWIVVPKRRSGRERGAKPPTHTLQTQFPA